MARKYERLTKVDGVNDILGQAAQVLDCMSESAIAANDHKHMSTAAALWMELAKFYMEEGVSEQGVEVSDLESDTELGEEDPFPVGFARPNI